MPLSSRLTSTVTATQVGTATALDLGTVTGLTALVGPQTRDLILADGTGAGQADRLFSDTRTIAASSNDDLDLAGVLVDALGATITFARVKGLYVAAATANTNNVLIGAGTNPFINLLNATGVITLRPGAWITFGVGATDATGAAVTAATGDILRIANSGAGTTVNYDIIIIGASV
jgi:hypothetical protein